jgi:hypothetical protein
MILTFIVIVAVWAALTVLAAVVSPLAGFLVGLLGLVGLFLWLS